ncbi:uncharacterized protein BKA78DRAFT_379663 [Phyllosticta capitalensis]|uniref:uncharacterized protein n=1 Tax=Phyllosticta capitalensis TaxID=121624 RepID=UPI00312D5334
MPKDWQSIHDELNRRRVSNEEVQRIIDGHTKSKSDLESYIEYTKTTVHQSLTTAPSTTSLVDFISNASLAACDKPEYREWLNKMLHPAQTPIPLGRTTNAFYRFHPNPRELNADDEELEDETAGKHPGSHTPRSWFPPPKRTSQQRRQQQTSDESDEGAGGFIFHQLGILQSMKGFYQGEERDPTQWRFSSTDFYLVAKPTASGMADELAVHHPRHGSSH